MVTAEESQTYQQISAQNSSYLDHMALLRQNYNLPCFASSTLATNIAFPGQSASDLHGLNTRQQDATGGFLNPLPSFCNISDLTGNPHLKGAQCALSHGLGLIDKAIDYSHAPPKRFLIFDQSGNHMRLFFSPSFSPQNQSFASKTPAMANGLREEVAAQVDQQFLVKPIIEEAWDENHLIDGGGDMLEDTEEINALLYSSSDDEYDHNDDDDGENDEVTSTGHSPFIIEEGYNKDKLLEELAEEVASSDESPKRQRLLNGKYKKSSLASVESPARQPVSCSDEDDIESSCAGDGNSFDEIGMGEREKKVKVRQALKALESIIPGLNTKDPLTIIDKAIVFLKSMKTEVEALGHSYPGCTSATSP